MLCMYTCIGDLTEQSYIPMTSSITGSVVTRRRSSNAVNQPGFWIGTCIK